MTNLLKSLSLLILVKAIGHSAQVIELTDVIQTNKGPIQGRVLTTIQKGVKYAAFRAIPYAKPPVGYHRFQPSEETDVWTDVLKAIDEPSVCPQWNGDDDGFVGNEDCLYLNVYTPKINSEDKSIRAVMIWIYGGAFVIGSINSTKYGPDFLIEENVVVVAMNYRLGALGFLSLDHKNASGNAGLKDQNLALQWVQKNIHRFGGDPEKVTIFGQSAGAVAVELHRLSDLSTGLFRNSIAMSGSPLNGWGFHTPQQAKSRAFRLGRKLGASTNDKAELLNVLYSATTKDIITATHNMFLFDLPFKPTIEDSKIATKPFLTDCPFSLYKSGSFSQQPHIMGFTHCETVSFLDSVKSLQQVINLALESTTTVNISSQLSEISMIRNLLEPIRSGIRSITVDIAEDAINITTDLLFVVGIERTQKIFAAKSSAPVYYYRNLFDYNHALHKENGVPLNGTGHTDDVAHIFWKQNYNQDLDTDSDIGIQRARMIRMWTNFAKYGNPTPNGTDPLLNITWLPSGADGHHLEMNKEYNVDVRSSSVLVEMTERIANMLQGVADGCLPIYNRIIPIL